MCRFAICVLVWIAAGALVRCHGVELFEARVIRAEVPKDGNASFVFEISEKAAEYAEGAPSLKVSVDFVVTSINREIHLFYEHGSKLYSRSTEHTLDLALFNCSEGCTVPFVLQGLCNKMSCVESISVRVWARLGNAAGEYVYSNAKPPYMPLYPDYFTPDMKIKSNEYMYFEYIADAPSSLMCRLSSGLASTVLLVSGKDSIVRPTQEHNAWVMIDNNDFRDFVRGPNYLGLYGKASIVGSATGALCVGRQCDADAAAALGPSSLLALLTAVGASVMALGF